MKTLLIWFALAPPPKPYTPPKLVPCKTCFVLERPKVPNRDRIRR